MAANGHPKIFYNTTQDKMDIKIKKAKLVKGGTVEATYIDDDGNEISIKGNNIAHPDLKARLAALIPYFAELTEQKEADKYNWSDSDSEENKELMKRLDVRGVSLGGDDTCPIATLSGQRTLMSTKVLNLNTPPTDLESDEGGWARAEDFRFAIDAYFYEVEQYILERKWAVKQTEFDFENEDDPFAKAGPTEDAPSFTDPDTQNVA